MWEQARLAQKDSEGVGWPIKDVPSGKVVSSRLLGTFRPCVRQKSVRSALSWGGKHGGWWGSHEAAIDTVQNPHDTRGWSKQADTRQDRVTSCPLSLWPRL